jgi:hypothetical protein
VPAGRRSNMEDVWLYLHHMFKLIWRYRFFYRDLNDLLSRNRKLELHFKAIHAHKIKVARQLCEDLRSEGSLDASDQQIGAMATNMLPGAVDGWALPEWRDARPVREAV